jgi:hypothetical protein
VAAARKLVGRSPFKKQFRVNPTYPEITRIGFGEVTVDQKTYSCDICISVGGKVTKREDESAEDSTDPVSAIGPKELKKLCKGGPEVLFVGSGKSDHLELSEEARRYLAQRSIACEIQPSIKTVENYNRSKRRKALLIHVTG